MSKFIAKFAFAASLCAVPALVHAEARPGMIVKDKTGAIVGTIAAISPNGYTVRTQKHDIVVPASSFFESDGVLLFGMSRGELDAAYEQAANAADAAIVVGASVRGLKGTVIGKIAEFREAMVVVELEDGSKVQLPRSGFTGDSQGAIIGMSAEDLKAHMAGTKGQ